MLFQCICVFISYFRKEIQANKPTLPWYVMHNQIVKDCSLIVQNFNGFVIKN